MKENKALKILVMEDHGRYEGQSFPLFSKGTPVSELMPGADNEYLHWFPCVIEGHKTFVPDVFVTGGVLNRDYNPTEIEVEHGQTVELVEVVFEWLYVRDLSGNEGWLPANKAISVKSKPNCNEH